MLYMTISQDLISKRMRMCTETWKIKDFPGIRIVTANRNSGYGRETGTRTQSQ